MRKTVFAALLAGTALLLAAAPAAFAWQGPITDGRPDLDQSSPTGFYLTANDDQFELRTHGPNAEPDFDAVLRTGGTFENIDPVRLERANHDVVDVRDGGHELVIHFHTYDFTDGVKFTIRGGQRLHLDLKLDDQLAPTDQIFLGSNGSHPDNNPFTIRR